MQNFPELHTVTEDAFIAGVFVMGFGVCLLLIAVIVNAWQWWRRPKNKPMARMTERERMLLRMWSEND